MRGRKTCFSSSHFHWCHEKCIKRKTLMTGWDETRDNELKSWSKQTTIAVGNSTPRGFNISSIRTYNCSSNYSINRKMSKNYSTGTYIWELRSLKTFIYVWVSLFMLRVVVFWKWTSQTVYKKVCGIRIKRS